MPWVSSYCPLDSQLLMSSVALAGSQPVCSPSSDREHLDVRVLGQGLLEARVAVGVGGVPGEAAHVVDVALAAQLLEQPLGAEVGVVDLVVVEVVGVRVVRERVDRDGLDAGRLGLVERRDQRVGIVRVEHDRVDVRRDEGAQLLELLLGRAVLVDDVQRRPPGREASASARAVQTCSSRKPLPTPPALRVADLPAAGRLRSGTRWPGPRWPVPGSPAPALAGAADGAPWWPPPPPHAADDERDRADRDQAPGLAQLLHMLRSPPCGGR